MNPEIATTTRTDSHGIATATTRYPKMLGIPVRYDPNLPVLSDSHGIWPFKRISVGPAFLALPERQQGAVLLHEAGHCKLFHTERIVLHVILHPRLLWAIVAASIAAAHRFNRESAESLIWFQNEIERRAPGIGAYRRSLESQADYFCAQCGYGGDLAQAFLMMGEEGGPFHPPRMERIRSLVGAIQPAVFDPEPESRL